MSRWVQENLLEDVFNNREFKTILLDEDLFNFGFYTQLFYFECRSYVRFISPKFTVVSFYSTNLKSLLIFCPKHEYVLYIKH